LLIASRRGVRLTPSCSESLVSTIFSPFFNWPVNIISLTASYVCSYIVVFLLVIINLTLSINEVAIFITVIIHYYIVLCLTKTYMYTIIHNCIQNNPVWCTLK